MKRAFTWSFVAVTIIAGNAGNCSASMITVDASGRGWISPQVGINGNDATNNYIVGANEAPAQYRNHFDFAIPVLSETLISATLNLVNPDHTGPTSTYTLYSLGAFGTYGFSDIGTGTPYGSVVISTEGLISITLNAAALSDILAAQGGTFSLGGTSTGEPLFPGLAYDFGFSGGPASNTQLILETVVPEPGSLTLVGLGAFGLVAGAIRRRRQSTIAD